MNKEFAGIGLLLLFALPLTSCQHGRQQQNRPNIVDVEEKIRSSLIGRSCSTVNLVIPTEELHEQTEAQIVLLYNGYDCDKCIEDGFSIAKYIDAHFSRQRVFIVSIMANTGFDQLRFDYSHYIFTDDSDVIRKELKYVPTPVMLQIDTSWYISDAIYLGVTNNVTRSQFIHSILSNQ